MTKKIQEKSVGAKPKVSTLEAQHIDLHHHNVLFDNCAAMIGEYHIKSNLWINPTICA